MPEAKEQITTTILAVILVLLFFGVLFIFMLSYIHYRRRQTAREKKDMQDQFDQQLMQTRLEIQEQTFRYLSEEIHDHVGQLLSLAKIQLSSFKEHEPIDFPMLKDAGANVARALQDLRSLAKGLHAGHIRHFSIREAVDEEVQRVRKAGGLTVSVTSEGAEKKIKEEKQLILFRVIQECLQNCLKHAAATNINIGFTWYSDSLRIRVRDDGCGFDTDTAPTLAGGLGLENIRNRARLTGGTSSIISRQGEGTTVTVQIPYE
jgi:two-component system NarL family sensor kinase